MQVLVTALILITWSALLINHEHIATARTERPVVTHTQENALPKRINLSPLHEAARRGHVEAVRVILDHGADINAKDEEGRTALHLAVVNGLQGVTQLLLENEGMDVNIQDETGQTALHMIAQQEQQEQHDSSSSSSASREELVWVLLAGGASTSVLNHDGQKASQLSFSDLIEEHDRAEAEKAEAVKNLYDSSSTTTTITAAVAATEDDEDHDDHYDADAVVEKDAGDDGFQLAGLTVREVGNLFAAHDLGMYLQVLEANGVDGSILADPALCEQDLEDMGMKPFHYRKVFRLIERWLESGCEFSNS